MPFVGEDRVFVKDFHKLNFDLHEQRHHYSHKVNRVHRELLDHDHFDQVNQ
jgi:hypothetical protein